MTDRQPDVRCLVDPEGELERALIDEFLRGRGYDAPTVAALPAAERQRVLRDACVYAAGKLAEVESRSRFLHEIHGVKGETAHRRSETTAVPEHYED